MSTNRVKAIKNRGAKKASQPVNLDGFSYGELRKMAKEKGINSFGVSKSDLLGLLS